MAQFLTGILPLKIETGSFKKICEMCTIGEPEDEKHFYAHVPFIFRLGSHFLMKQ